MKLFWMISINLFVDDLLLNLIFDSLGLNDNYNRDILR